MRKYLPLAFAGVLLVGCATQPATPTATTAAPAPNGIQQAVTSVQTFTAKDLAAADADAVAHNDTLAHQCWSGLEPIVAGFQSPIPATAPIGIASGVQAGRDVIKFGEGLAGGLPSATRTAIAVSCGPLALDAQTDINQGIIAFGGTSINLLKIVPAIP